MCQIIVYLHPKRDFSQSGIGQPRSLSFPWAGVTPSSQQPNFVSVQVFGFVQPAPNGPVAGLSPSGQPAKRMTKEIGEKII